MEAIAIYDFTGQDEHELNFMKSDRLKILDMNTETGWFRGELEGKEGLIPSNYIEMKPHPWYISGINRQDTEKMLLETNETNVCIQQDGTFILRSSQRSTGIFVLSVKIGNSVRHFNVHGSEGSYFFLDAIKFDSINALIKHHRTSSITHSDIILLHDAKQQTDANEDSTGRSNVRDMLKQIEQNDKTEASTTGHKMEHKIQKKWHMPNISPADQGLGNTLSQKPPDSDMHVPRPETASMESPPSHTQPACVFPTDSSTKQLQQTNKTHKLTTHQSFGEILNKFKQNDGTNDSAAGQTERVTQKPKILPRTEASRVNQSFKDMLNKTLQQVNLNKASTADQSLEGTLSPGLVGSESSTTHPEATNVDSSLDMSMFRTLVSSVIVPDDSKCESDVCETNPNLAVDQSDRETEVQHTNGNNVSSADQSVMDMLFQTLSTIQSELDTSYPTLTENQSDSEPDILPQSNSTTSSVWKWFTENNAWQSYSMENSVLFEAAWKQNRNQDVWFTAGGNKYILHLASMQQENVSTNMKRNVQRSGPDSLTQSAMSLEKTTSSDWKWFTEHNDWQSYSMENCVLFEAAWTQNRDQDVSFTAGSHSYILHLASMQQENVSTHMKRQVQRSGTDSLKQSALSLDNTTNIDWKWFTENNVWQSYSMEHSSQFESAWNENKAQDVSFTAGSNKYILHLASMQQENVSTHVKRNVQRNGPNVPNSLIHNTSTDNMKRNVYHRLVAPPADWHNTAEELFNHSEQFRSYQVDIGTTDYTLVENMFKKTLPNSSIIELKRIENIILFDKYEREKVQMACTRRTDEDIKICSLFHGTDDKNIDAISAQGFDWRLNGSHGTAYGKGTYFARDASYSVSYGKNYMFLADVLVGEYTQGSSVFVRPPSYQGNMGNLYDSVVNNVNDPSIYVIFENSKAYPKYLIKFRT